MTTIKDLWEEFDNACLRGVSDQQRREAKTSFYAGIAAFMKLPRDLCNSGMPESELLEYFIRWTDEINGFAAAMIEITAAEVAQEIIARASRSAQPDKD